MRAGPTLTNLDSDAERRALIAWHRALRCEHRELLAADMQIGAGTDRRVLRAHTLRLARHHRQMEAFNDALRLFHDRFAPLDGSDPIHELGAGLATTPHSSDKTRGRYDPA